MSNLPESYSLIEKLEQFFYIFVNFFFRFLTFLTFLLCQIVQIVRYSFSARLVVTFRGVKLAKGTIFGWDNWENLDEPWRTETDCFWRTETDWFWRTETDWFWLRHVCFANLDELRPIDFDWDMFVLRTLTETNWVGLFELGCFWLVVPCTMYPQT